MTRTIEDIILDHDRRGINALRPHLPEDFCVQAARYVLEHPGQVIIATGFYIMMSDAPETDGPPGAFAIGNALRELGNPVAYTADEPMAYMMASWRARHRDPSPIIRFPIIEDPGINGRFVQETIDNREPALLISIERCSPRCRRHLPQHEGARHLAPDRPHRQTVRLGLAFRWHW